MCSVHIDFSTQSDKIPADRVVLFNFQTLQIAENKAVNCVLEIALFFFLGRIISLRLSTIDDFATIFVEDKKQRSERMVNVLGARIVWGAFHPLFGDNNSSD